jgi:hypothetical protein
MTIQLFIDNCTKHPDGIVKERFSNTGKSMCLYTKENSPICYIDLERFQKLRKLFKEVKDGYKIDLK